MTIKSWAEAHRYKGGIIRYLYDAIKSLDASGYDDTALKARVKALEDAIGTYSDEDTIAERLDALENAE